MSTNNHERISVSANGKPWQYADGMETVNCIANSNINSIINNTLPGISKPGSAAETASAASNTSFSANNNIINPFSLIEVPSVVTSHQESASAGGGTSSAGPGHDPRIGVVGVDSGESSPGHSTHSTSNCSRTARSDESLRPRLSGSRECGDIQWIYNTPPEIGLWIFNIN